MLDLVVLLLLVGESWPGAAGSVGCDPHSIARPPYYGSTSILWPGPGVDISPHAALPRLHSTTPSAPNYPIPTLLQTTPLHFHTLPCTAPLSKTCQAAAFCPLLAPTLLLLPRRTKCNAALSELVKPTLNTGVLLNMFKIAILRMRHLYSAQIQCSFEIWASDSACMYVTNTLCAEC